MPSNSETFVTWKAYWTGGLATITVVVSISIAVYVAHTSRPHKDAVYHIDLQEHVSTAREERKEISAKISHVEASVHQVEVDQAVMVKTLENIYKEVKASNAIAKHNREMMMNTNPNN